VVGKRKFYFQWFALAAFSLACAAQIPVSTDKAPEKGSCVPGPYCARTDRKTEVYPEKAPALGPAGSIITDPVFGSRIVRVTDQNTDRVKAGRSVYSPSSAEQNTWNKTSTMFYVTTDGGSFLLFHFDPSTMKPRIAETPALHWGPEPQFSFAQNNILYGMHHPEATIEQYDIASGKVSEINKLSKCVKLGAGEGASVISVSADDNRLMTTLGPGQNKNYLVYVYERNRGCRWYNTETGEIGGDWGPKGTISVPDRFLVHNARIAKSGKFVYVTRGTNSSPGHRWVVWQLDTLNVSVCAKACSGHHVMGYSHILGTSGFHHPMEVLLRPLDHVEESRSMIEGLEPGKKEWYDSHFSWNNVDPDDTAPVCYSTFLPTNSAAAGTAPMVTGPWENEIDCAETDGKGSKVWRFAHTYSSAKNGFWSSPRGNISQDGRFFEFTSDWENLLGTGPNGKNRMDVFVVELK
jgi:hypothetical protein